MGKVDDEIQRTFTHSMAKEMDKLILGIMTQLHNDLKKSKENAIVALQAYRNKLGNLIESGEASQSYLYGYINRKVEVDKLISDLVNE